VYRANRSRELACDRRLARPRQAAERDQHRPGSIPPARSA
jgi:hypothetical protein